MLKHAALYYIIVPDLSEIKKKIQTNNVNFEMLYYYIFRFLLSHNCFMDTRRVQYVQSKRIKKFIYSWLYR